MSYSVILDGYGNTVHPKKSGIGIKIDTGAATFGYKDLLGQVFPHVGGGTAPVSTLVRGTATHVRAYAFDAASVMDDITLHLPHDYVPNTDIYFHIHWTHAGTAISGNLVADWYVTYCKGYNQSSQTFAAEKNITQTVSTPNIATIPQYSHQISEFQLSNNGGDATHLDTTLLEPDGIVKLGMVMTTVPTITGAPAGSANSPFILMADIHYQSTQLATKNKNFPFYS